MDITTARPESPQRQNSFKLLGQYIQTSFKEPLGSFTFVAYSLIGVIGMGGLSIWIEVHRYVFDPGPPKPIDGILMALITFFPAIGCTAALDMALGQKARHLQSFGILVASFFIVACLIANSMRPNHSFWSLGLSIACSLLAFIAWWIANGKDEKWNDSPPDAPLGGSAACPLSGETQGYTV